MLVESFPDPAHDTHPIDSNDRDAWLVIVPTQITGRRVVDCSGRWTFHPAGYL